MSLCILHADDTRKGGWSAQASSGPSSADCTAVVTVAIGTISAATSTSKHSRPLVGSRCHFISFFGQPKHRVHRFFLHRRMPPPTASTHQPSTHSALSGSHHATLPFHQNTICPDATQTPLPNTARSCSPRRQHTPIWSIIPFYSAQLFYQHSPAHPWPYVTTPFVRFASSRDWNHGMSTFAMRLCLAAVRPLVSCIGGPGTPAACMHCTDRSRSITDDWG